MVTSWQAVALLVDRGRRALYEYVRRQRRPVTRDEAAQAAGISRNLAAFHLDKLAEVGLLRASYQAPGGKPRTRGRTPKVYQPTSEGILLAIPERRYELIAEILAQAVAGRPANAGEEALRLAHDRGRRLGNISRDKPAPQEVVDADNGLRVAAEVLAELGFEPHRPDPERITLHNCPYQAVATQHPDLICALNQAFLDGLLRGLGHRGLEALLAPQPGTCCVQLRKAA